MSIFWREGVNGAIDVIQSQEAANRLAGELAEWCERDTDEAVLRVVNCLSDLIATRTGVER